MEQDQGERAPEAPQPPVGEAGPQGDAGEPAPPLEVESGPEAAGGEAVATGEGRRAAAKPGARGRVKPVEQEAPLPVAASTGTTPDARTGGRVMADHVNVEQGAIGSAEGLNVDVLQGAIGFARGEQIRLSQGGIGVALANDIHLQMGGAQLVVAKESVRIEQGAAATVLTQRAELARGSFVGFLVALHAEGETRAMFDWRGALAFGAAFAVVSSVLRRGRGRR